MPRTATAMHRLPILRLLTLGLLAAALMGGCTHRGTPLTQAPAPNRPDQTGLEYAPDMYHSIPLEPYSQYVNEDFFPGGYNQYFLEAYGNGGNAQAPVAGTIARGKMDHYFEIPMSNEGYELSAQLANPVPFTAANVAEGKRLYTLYCVHCHGKQGKGDGSIPAAGKFPPPPAYDGPLKELEEGKMFYSITYGKNLMGSHASQLNPTERWTIIRFVQTLQGKQPQAVAEASAQAPTGEQTPDAVASN